VNLQKQGIIVNHFPLHKRRRKDINDTFDLAKYRLMIGFVTGSFYDHFTSMNFIKSYYGEKYAFEFAFLLHYQAWLVFPAVVGLIIFGI
jgi:hypothetical protein